MIYELIFGTTSGQVNCCFHNDSVASAGISPEGGYNCFACGAKAHDEIGFIAKYFSVGLERAANILKNLERSQAYRYNKLPIQTYQRTFLHSIGLTDLIIDRYFFCSGVGKLIYEHTFNGIAIGHTWFNSPALANHNASAPKYKYDGANIGGMLSPYDDVIQYDTLLICEGEKDMLTAKSKGFANAVAKIGGAKTYIIGGINLYNKKIVIVYDCDEAGRQGALQDATLLTERFKCSVKILDLGLADKEDLNDYFIKYQKTVQDFQTLVQNTPVFVPVVISQTTRMEKIVENLSNEEVKELQQLIQNRLTQKGEE